ncbi:MAG: two-component system, OmpR family, sensor kinase [Acidimicrobiaceae bacterium]
MTRRLTLAIVGTVLATLVMAGAGTLLLARLGAREQTENDLRSQASVIAKEIKDASDQGTLRILTNLSRALNLQGVTVVRYGPGGRTVDALPAGVEATDLDQAALRDGRTVSGNHGSLVYAATATPLTVTRNTGASSTLLAVVVITRTADPLLRPATGWFLIAALATLAIGVVVAWRVGRRMTRPLRQVEEATRRIATGDLSTRLPAPDKGTDDELVSLMRSINTMAEGLERSRGVERQFLLSISHDLRTPLTSIRGYAEAITDGALADPAAGAGVILAEARRLERLVRDLLDLNKLDARSFSFDLQPLDLIDVAIGTADGFLPEAEEAGVTVEVESPDGPVLVSGDADRLAQVGANLLENALKFARSRVTVRVSKRDGWARLDVIDDGPGIAGEDLPHVFERLYVSRHRPQRKEAGSGLGLAIVRELVAAHGGAVEASAAPGGGASLSVLLPLAPVSAPS